MENINNLENYSAAIDLPDSRDYTTEEIFGEVGGSVDLPSSFMLNKAPNLEQGNIGSCTIHGSTNAFNEKYAHALPENVIYEHPYDPWKAWAECKKRGASDEKGFIFQAALQVLKDLNYIGAYVHLNTRQHANLTKMKEAMFLRKSGVATGFNSVNWSRTLQNREYTKGSYDGQGAHIFDVVGWDDKKILPSGKVGAFYVANSWGEGGHFWIAYADIGDLYSQYEFLLTTEQEKFIEARKKRANKYLQLAFDKKIWNEERPADTATAREIRIMLNRALAVTDNKISEDWVTFRSSYAMIFEEKIIRGKAKLYNEERKFNLASDDEIAIMFTRAVTRNAGLNILVLTRQQVVEAIARDFLSEV
jgi:hypothetical protein|nr:MAG TPA: Cysteine protease [Bacteriophage sp.]